MTDRLKRLLPFLLGAAILLPAASCETSPGAETGDAGTGDAVIVAPAPADG